MHTYNEAIRRTVGSFVLYPGNDARLNYQDSGSERNLYRRYHEIIPGIGAFAVKPKAYNGNHGALGVESLRQFFMDFLTHQASKFTQSHRINYWTHDTIREQPAELASSPLRFSSSAKPPKDVQVLLGFVRDDLGAETCRQASVFYCHAVEWKPDCSSEPGEATDLKFDPFRSDFFIPYFENRTVNWVAKVKEVNLVTAQERANEIHRPIEKMKAAYYYRFQLEDIQEIASRDVSTLVHRRPGKPIARALSDFASCPAIPAADP
jgi:hypothetical protein